jgi:nitrous oxidase accessory protein NosD
VRVRRVSLVLLGSLVLAVGALRTNDLLGQPAPEARLAARSWRCDRTIGPDASAPRLVRGLQPGQTGCLRGGTYRGDVTFRRPRVTLRAAPGARAKVTGRLWVASGADGVQVAGLLLDGRSPSGLPSPTVNADDARFTSNNITNAHTGICVLLGSGWGRARRTVLRENRIHDCGRRPSTNQDHGVYVAEADDTLIVDNVIYDNADRGVQLYPDAQRTLIEGNIIDGNGEGIIFSGQGDLASRGTLVRNNIIANATSRADVESWYASGGRRGADNVVRDNCIFGGRGGTVDEAGGGFTALANADQRPGYRDRAHGDFRLEAADPCGRVLSGSRAPAGPHGEPPIAGQTG